MLLNLRPLIHYREYRLLLIGQLVSFMGSMITYVAMPWQIYDLTRSSFLVGLLGSVQLVPILVFGLLGGSVADSMDRRKLLLVSEAFMSLGALVLALNAWQSSPNVALIFVTGGLMQAANGFHRPAMDAMTQKLVDRADFSAVGALNSLRYGIGAVLGPALGGILIASYGIQVAYLFDFGTFLIALISLYLMAPMPLPRKTKTHFAGILEGLKYAFSRKVLLGTYIVDIVAMTFAFPTALFPALGEQWGGAKEAGALFSAMAVGSLAITLVSGWTAPRRRHGAWVIVSAGLWGLGIAGLGVTSSFPFALFCLAFAGAADAVSAIFRQVIWNETIPNEMRGRLAGIEMISYMSGPLLGNTRAGWMASITNNQISIVSGGIICTVGVALCAALLPQFWKYRSTVST